ncbi:hypothetical protein DLR60_07770, partial [Vibrio tarriae]
LGGGWEGCFPPNQANSATQAPSLPLPLLGGGWEGVFRASIAKMLVPFTSAKAKIPHPTPPLEGEGTEW